jgi:hypothetical protein
LGEAVYLEKRGFGACPRFSRPVTFVACVLSAPGCSPNKGIAANCQARAAIKTRSKKLLGGIASNPLTFNDFILKSGLEEAFRSKPDQKYTAHAQYGT